ncbi:NmrA family transcriptional regulator [Nibricoccus aquaticus]|uniref:NmrA family transcriptional regulator n=1 Tax=Nibricoccus aquaticus TaxID=2576891 RepID=A0A290QAW8_9BACT|nr:SDR family oxidoreductase [Nibricoccus aquaticus]ATC65583.1 NmrA family transcriptional regulator [Nibricoccus aquaticus]
MNTPSSSKSLKIVVIGGTGLIGRKLIPILRTLGHTAVPASPSTGVNAVTGEGLANALAGADVVVDVSNSPSFEKQAAMDFFVNSTRNLLAAEAAAGVRHHVALSVVGTDRVPDSDYFLAKLAMENLLSAGPVPHTIVRATQFFEFAPSIIYGATEGDFVRVPPALMQPIAADDVARLLAAISTAAPINGIVKIAGPEPIRMPGFARDYLLASGDPRQVKTDPAARYFGAAVDDRSLTPASPARRGSILFKDWLAHNVAPKPAAVAS